MAKRSEKRDAAKAEYIRRRANGEKVVLARLAEELGVNKQTMLNWKSRDKWDEAIPPKKRGAQPGNKNCKGKKNAAGSHKGAPKRNKNAEKDGAYSAVYFDMLTDAERELIDKTPLAARDALEHEMKILKFREHKILGKLAEYEEAAEDSVYLQTVTEIHGKNNTTIKNSDSAFRRVESLQEALYKVQGRIAKIADSLRAMDENASRMQLERERLEIMRSKETGVVEEPKDAADVKPVPGVVVEDAQ